MIKQNFIRACYAAGAALGLASAANADFAFNDFVGGGGSVNGMSVGTFDIADAYINPASSARIAFGYQFVASSSGVLSQIDAALEYDGVSANTIGLELYSDSGGHLGANLKSWTLVNQMQQWSPLLITSANVYSTGPVVAATNADPTITLTAGDAYWVVAVWQPGTGSNYGWFLSVAGAGTTSFSNGLLWPSTSGQLYQGAFDVQVNPVPEPSSLLLVGIGAFCVARRRRVRTA